LVKTCNQGLDLRGVFALFLTKINAFGFDSLGALAAASLSSKKPAANATGFLVIQSICF